MQGPAVAVSNDPFMQGPLTQRKDSLNQAIQAPLQLY